MTLDSPSPPPKWQDFLRSPHHAVLAVGTLGVGFVIAEPFPLLLGVAGYLLGWIYLPDTGWFRKWREARIDKAVQSASVQEIAAFQARRNNMLDLLAQPRKERYRTLAGICREIEHHIEQTQGASASDDVRVRKLEELMWTYLRLLTTEQGIERFLAVEERENLAAQFAVADQHRSDLAAELAQLPATGNAARRDAMEKLLKSRTDVAETLQKRIHACEEARANFALVSSEQERLEQQIKLLRSESLASRHASTDALTARIDATMDHLKETNSWLTRIDQVSELEANLPMPAESQRLGFGEGGAGATTPPPIPKRRLRASE